ncbi:MAG: response regulator [Deltaproteobacteria bacterium]|jgi:DNA-binding response OmpR family regulator|nr:response regulator [Deltaproteobacteria bacterium]
MTKILVADDEYLLRELYAAEFSNEGYEVISTGDYDGVMEMIEQNSPDLIVLDIRMGECNGLDLLQDIRNSYRDKPVILCTAYPSFRHDLKSIAADYYVIKSQDLTELKTKINMALSAGAAPITPCHAGASTPENEKSLF